MKKIKQLLLVIALFFSAMSWAQQQVRGVVTDDKNMPLPGVDVLIKGTTTGMSTNFDGEFSLSLSNGDVLVISYLGYETKEIVYKGESNLAITLAEDSTELDEVVIVGYGTVKKTDLTGSVSTLDSKSIEKTNKVDAVSALQGQAAGVVIQRTDNKPGSGGFNIRIRGASTINSNQTADQGGFTPGQNPLFVVDGIFVDDISFLNPADIERMDVLKDASATAVYGSRGSNGVVIIETKKGKSGKLSVSYSNYIGFKQAYNLPSVFNGSEYIDFVKDVVVGNVFATADGDLNYRSSDVVLSDYLDAEEMQNVADGISTDWVDLILENGIQTNHTINLNGGSDVTTYSAGLAYTKDDGTVGGETFDRYNIRASLSSDLTKWLNLSVNNYITSAIQDAGSFEALRSAYRLKPIGRAYNEDGSLRFFPTQKETQISNPLFEKDNITKETKYLQYLANFAIKISPLEGLTLTSTFSPNIKFTRYGEYRSLYSKSVNANPVNRRAQVNNSNYFSYSWDNIVNYNLEKGDHNVGFTGVFSRFLERSEIYQTQVRNFTTDEFSFYNLDAGLSINEVSSALTKQTLESYTGRINYSFKDKYLLTVTGRYDGASILAEENKWAFFPSVALGWKMSEENFMQNQDVLSNAKLRLSYGQTGNNGQGGGLGPLASLSLLGSEATNINDTATSTYYITGLANQDLSWERTTEVNLGFDFGFLNNRINGSIDVYNRKNTDIIFYRNVPLVTGYTGTYENIGESTNRGIEIGINSTNINKGGFKWSTNLNFASNKNTLDKLYGGVDEIIFGINGTNYIHKVGEPIGAIYDYVFDGIWQLDEVDEAAAYGQRPGQVKVKDLNGDGEITADADREIIGQAAPKWTGGITNTFDYKNFDFSFFLNISQGNTVLSNFHNALSYPYDGEPGRVFNGYNTNYWTPENPTNDWYQPGNGGTYQQAIKYKDISFVKVGYMTLGYTLSEDLLDKLKIGSLRIYATVQNPFVFTKYDGWDPENAGRNQWGAAFMSRTFMTGLNINF